jgi:hypothetical protein
MSLIGAEYTKVFRGSHSQKSRVFYGQGRVQASWVCLQRPIHWSLKVWFRCRLTMQRKLRGAPSCLNHMCCRWGRGTCSKSTGNHWSPKKRWYTASVSLLGKKTDHKSRSPKMPAQTLAKNQCWCLDAEVVWGLSSTQTWDLRKFTISSLVNPALSVNRMLTISCLSTTFFVRSHWQNTMHAPWSGGVKTCIHWMWNG